MKRLQANPEGRRREEQQLAQAPDRMSPGTPAVPSPPPAAAAPASDPDALLPIGTEVQVRFEGWSGFVSGMIKGTYVVYTKGINRGIKALRPRACLIPVVSKEIIEESIAGIMFPQVLKKQMFANP